MLIVADVVVVVVVIMVVVRVIVTMTGIVVGTLAHARTSQRFVEDHSGASGQAATNAGLSERPSGA